MKHIYAKFKLLVVLGLMAWYSTEAQNNVGIGTTNPNINALLQLRSADIKGFQMPGLKSLDTASFSALSAKDKGLIFYDTTTQFYRYYDGLKWQILAGNASNPAFSSLSDGKVPYWDATYKRFFNSPIHTNANGVGVNSLPVAGYSFNVAATGSVAPTLDQSASTTDNSWCISNNPWQSFTVGKTGKLSRIGIQSANTTAGPVNGTLRVYEGEGIGGTLLADEPFVLPQYTAIDQFQTYDLSTTVLVTAGQVYTINVTSGTCAINVRRSFSDIYAGGRSNIGVSVDLGFQTFVSPITNFGLLNNGNFEFSGSGIFRSHATFEGNLIIGSLSNGIMKISGGNVTSAALTSSEIPNLDAAKITTGTFTASQIPNLDAAKITTGTLPVSRGGTGVSSLTVARVLVGQLSGIQSAGGLIWDDLNSRLTINNTVGGSSNLQVHGTINFASFGAGVLKTNSSGQVSSAALLASEIPALDAAKINTGVLPIARGGTGGNTFTTSKLIYYNGTKMVSAPNVHYDNVSGDFWAKGMVAFTDMEGTTTNATTYVPITSQQIYIPTGARRVTVRLYAGHSLTTTSGNVRLHLSTNYSTAISTSTTYQYYTLSVDIPVGFDGWQDIFIEATCSGSTRQLGVSRIVAIFDVP